MALNADTLKTELRAALLAAGCNAVDCDQLTGLCKAIADAVVAHITANATVTVQPGIGVTVAIPAGTGSTVTPGMGTIS